MKQIKYFRSACRLLAGIWLGASFVACADDLEVGRVDEQKYEITGQRLAYLSDSQGKRLFSQLEFRAAGSLELFLNAPKTAQEEARVAVAYDRSVLEAFNQANNTSYEPFPEQLIAFDAEGNFTLAPGATRSAALVLNCTSDGSLSHEKSYVIPLRMRVTAGNLELKADDATRLVFVRDLTGLPDCNKASGVKIFSCMEVNDTNPLNNLSFTLKSTGQPLVDALILFSANINYDEKTGRVYIYNNENVQALLDNREHYLKPLQDRGIKVILGLLGNHDRSGIANLSDATAKAFAQEVKAMCDAYQLDGIFVDDEYSKYQTPPPPGFVSPSSEAASRLCYEIKQAQPHRSVIAYVYSRTKSLNTVDGVKPGDYIDYALHDYGGSYDLSSNYPGLPKANMGLYSQEFAQGRFASEANLRKMRANGYLSHMLFAMDPNRWNFFSQLNAMQTVARALFDDELVFDGTKYPKDWIK